MVVATSLTTHHNLTLKPTATANIKFVCSYGGKIVPRYPDGKLRYHGGDTRILSVHRSITFSELMVKLGEMCGTTSLSLRCQLPTEDLDALISVTSDEDLTNLIEEYDRAAVHNTTSLKIRAFLLQPPKKSSSPTSSTASSSSTSTATLSPKSPPPKSNSPKSPPPYSGGSAIPPRYPVPAAAAGRCIHQVSSKPVKFPIHGSRSAGKLPYYAAPAYGNPGRNHLVHHGNHWQ